MKKATPEGTTRPQIKRATMSDILGGPGRVVPAATARQAEPTVCFSCLKKIPSDRISALRNLGVPFDRWTCVACANLVTTPRLGIFMGEVGTSELKIVDRIYTDSVRDVFMEPDTVETSDKD